MQYRNALKICLKKDPFHLKCFHNCTRNRHETLVHPCPSVMYDKLVVWTTCDKCSTTQIKKKDLSAVYYEILANST